MDLYSLDKQHRPSSSEYRVDEAKETFAFEVIVRM